MPLYFRIERLVSGCWGWCIGGIAGPILARAAFSVRPYRDEVDSEDEREETLHYFKTGVNRSQETAISRSFQNNNQASKQIEHQDSNTECESLSQTFDDEVKGTSGQQPSILVSQCSDAQDPTGSELEICVREAYDLAMPEPDSNCHSQVRMALLPDRKQRFKTIVVPGTNPKFHETHVFTHVSQVREHETTGGKLEKPIVGESGAKLKSIVMGPPSALATRKRGRPPTRTLAPAPKKLVDVEAVGANRRGRALTPTPTPTPAPAPAPEKLVGPVGAGASNSKPAEMHTITAPLIPNNTDNNTSEDGGRSGMSSVESSSRRMLSVLPLHAHPMLLLRLCEDCLRQSNSRIRICLGGHQHTAIVMCQTCIRSNKVIQALIDGKAL